MIRFLLAAAAFAAATPAFAQAPPPPRAIADQVSQESLRAMVERLVSFGTRHTLSSADHPTRGIGAARRWTEAEFRRYAEACGGCLEIVKPSDTVTGRRIPEPTLVENVFAIQRGTERPDQVVVISGHIDSRVSDVMDFASDAPGANDDGSGTAAVIEAARVLSRHRFPATIVYAVLSGEEQGLYGGRILANYAEAQGWEVVAVLNNDIIGNSCGSDGYCDSAHVRVFSEGPRGDWTPDYLAAVRSRGGENDSPSRNLSRWLDEFADAQALGIDVREIWRTDRFGRGGDHLEMLQAGYPAIRFTVAVEDYEHQHQDLRTEEGVRYGDTIDEMDFGYLARVTRLNVAALAALARAPRPPEPVAEGAVATDTTIRWEPVPGAVGYVLRWRPTDAPDWEKRLVLPAQASRHVLERVRVDDWVFGLSSLAADGTESPVASAVPGGAFEPLPPAEGN